MTLHYIDYSSYQGQFDADSVFWNLIFIFVLQWWFNFVSRMMQNYTTVAATSASHSKLVHISSFWFNFWIWFSDFNSFSFFFLNDHSMLLYVWSNAILLLVVPRWSHWLLCPPSRLQLWRGFPQPKFVVFDSFIFCSLHLLHCNAFMHLRVLSIFPRIFAAIMQKW